MSEFITDCLQITSNGLNWDLNPEFPCPKVHVPMHCVNPAPEFHGKVVFLRHCTWSCMKVSLLLIRLWTVNCWNLSGNICQLFIFESTSANIWTFQIAYRWTNASKPNPYGKERHQNGTLPRRSETCPINNTLFLDSQRQSHSFIQTVMTETYCE